MDKLNVLKGVDGVCQPYRIAKRPKASRLKITKDNTYNFQLEILLS